MTNGSVPQAISSLSDTPSLSSSKSSINCGSEVETPTNESGYPSPSVSIDAAGSSGNASISSTTPSSSLSWSKLSQNPSPSRSTGVLVLTNGSVPQTSSHESIQPSLSSSSSSLFPSPSESVSSHSVGLYGNASNSSVQPSLSSSSSNVSQLPSTSWSPGTLLESSLNVPHAFSIPSDHPSWSVSCNSASHTSGSSSDEKIGIDVSSNGSDEQISSSESI